MTAPVPLAGHTDAPFTTDAELLRPIDGAEPIFYHLWLADLYVHRGQWRHPRCVAPNAFYWELCEAARDAAHWRAAHDGWEIESGPEGYRLVGWHAPSEDRQVEGQLKLAVGV